MAAVGTVPGHLDLGGTVWERKLIKAFRRRNFLWRSEQCYPGWIKRMVRFIEPMAPETIDGEGIGRFLSEIALRGRVSPATQKQALNAIVFFMREGLGREAGEIDFRRARPKVRMPVVLTSGECSRLFGEMEGTGRYQRSVFGYLRDSPQVSQRWNRMALAVGFPVPPGRHRSGQRIEEEASRARWTGPEGS